MDEDRESLAPAQQGSRYTLGWWLEKLIVYTLASVGGLAFLAILLYLSGGVKFPAVQSLPHTAGPAAPVDGDTLGTMVSAAFGTIQFSVAVISALVLVGAVIVSFVVGRNAREAQETSSKRLAEITDLYKSGLEDRARRAVDEYLDIEGFKEDAERYRALFGQVTSQYREIEQKIRELERYEQQRAELEADYVGPYLKLSAIEDRAILAGTERELWQGEDERITLQAVLRNIEEGGLRRQVSASNAFNAAQTAARTQFNERSHRLAVLAAWLQDDRFYQLRVKRSEYERGDSFSVIKNPQTGLFELQSANPDNDAEKAAEIRAKALEDMVGEIKVVPLNNSELFYSEIFNVFVHGRRLDKFVEEMENAADIAERNGTYLPSYFHALTAHSYQIVGAPGWHERSAHHVAVALAKHQAESPTSSWYRHTLRDVQRVIKNLQTLSEQLELGGDPDDDRPGGAPPEGD